MKKEVYHCDLCRTRTTTPIQGVRTTLHFSFEDGPGPVDLCHSHWIVTKQVFDWLGVTCRIENNAPIGNVDVYVYVDLEDKDE